MGKSHNGNLIGYQGNSQQMLSFLLGPAQTLFNCELDLAYRKTDGNCIHRKDNAPKPLGPIISKL